MRGGVERVMMCGDVGGDVIYAFPFVDPCLCLSVPIVLIVVICTY